MSNNNDNASDQKNKYKDTVFLPTTAFPMRGELPKKEPEIVKKWQDMDLYGKMRTQSTGKPKFILHDGPPYANGHIHMGHALNKVLKDVVVRYKQMQGFDAPYVPGWDCHGLPIEWKVEEGYRARGANKDDVDALKFRGECRAFAQKWVDVQSADFQRLGISGDWKNPYLTMTNKAEGMIVREIHEFIKNGSLYKGAKPVMWSTVEKTALAEAEVEYKEHKSITVWVKFPIVKTTDKDLEGAFIVIWTTTPWTLPSNRAVAYGENIEYGLFEVKTVKEGSRAKTGDKIILATTLSGSVMKNAKIAEWDQLKIFKGIHLGQAVCAHPLHAQGYDTFEVPALAGDFVTEEAGTGFVHIAPGHGADDFMLGMANGIEITDNVTDDGKFRPHVPLFAGLEVYTQKGEMGEGNFAVLKALDEAGMLLAKGSLRHDYPHSWRSKAPVIFRTTPQWFIAMDDDNGIRQTALKAIQDTNWVPAKGQARITAMVENRPDWCISRQRSWGVPIALFVHKESGEALQDTAVLNRIGAIFEEEGSDSWWSRPAQDFLGNDYSADDYDQVFDIVDVWFESGSTHAFVLAEHQELQKPGLAAGQPPIDLYLEGSDQHRGWFQSSLLESCGTRGHAPFDTVLTHGFVLDEKGYKMSKSLGNIVDPLKIMDEFGADILRLWVMMSDYSEDIRIGQDTIKSAADIYRRLRNTFRFLLGALDGMSIDEMVELKDMPELERYMLHQIAVMDREVRSLSDSFEFGRLTHKLHNWCNNELSAFYFDIRKDSLYCDSPNDIKRRACRTVMAHLFDALSAWLAPVLCFTAEEAWSHRPPGLFADCESVHLREFPHIPEEWENKEFEERWAQIEKIRKDVLAAIEPLRASKELGSSLEAAPCVTISESEKAALADIDLAEICITAPVAVTSGEVQVSIKKAEGEKCVRCWKVLPEVAENSESLCNRCVKAVDELKKREAA